jgi:hypothetical protein
LSRAAKQINDEAAAAAERLRAAPEDGRKWWKQRAENELRCILMTATYHLLRSHATTDDYGA